LTLQNGLIVGKTAILWSDTAYYSADGQTLVGYAGKAFVGLQWPFAVSMTSVGGNQLQMAERVSALYPFSLPDLLRICSSVLRDFCRPGHLARLLIAAWDDTAGKPRMFLIRSESAPDEPAFEPIEALTYVSSHQDSEVCQRVARQGFTVNRMLEVIDEQHATPYDIDGNGLQLRLGGECMQIAVSRSGVKAETVREWGCASTPEI
jgi:hypothetical protein